MSARLDKVEFALRMGDNSLVLGHRLSEWCGHAPVLEEDLAISNTALDLLGFARQWLGYAGDMEGRGRDEDKLVFGRDAHEYRNVLLAEQDNGNYADTLARQLYFDIWHLLMWEGLGRSTDGKMAQWSLKAKDAVTFHARRSADLVVRLGDGSEDSHRRMQAAVDEFWIFTGELFEVDASDQRLIDAGVIPDMRLTQPHWLDRVSRILTQATLETPTGIAMRSGGRRGVHSEYLGFLLAEMQFLPRAYPGAKW